MFFFKQKTAYEMRISDWSSDVCSSDLQYLDARRITDPIHLFDCVMPCAGAEGYLVMREEQAAALGLKYVRILSTIERHNAWIEDPIQIRRVDHGSRRALDRKSTRLNSSH